MPTNNENITTVSPNLSRRHLDNALELGPRKKACFVDPLVHHGRHFGRTIHALCRVQALLTNGIIRETELDTAPEETLSFEDRNEHRIFKQLLQLVPGLQERLFSGDEEELVRIADLLQKGANGARSDDTKSLKGAILDWITPRGQALNPPLSRNIKIDQGFHHERTGALLCPTGLDWANIEVKEKLKSGELIITGDQWPVFLYSGYNYDPGDPWNGLFRSVLLVAAFKYIFTSPSSVDKEPKATRSGNARLHGMTKATPASIAYIATQVRFALSSSPVFSRTDTATDSERFYNSILDLFFDPEEQEEVNDLLAWWNRQIFPSYSTQRPASKDSALSRIKERRAAMRSLGNTATSSTC